MGLLRKIFKKPLNNLQGEIGEFKVKRKLNPLIFKVNHKLINNLTLMDDFGHTHQIDHIEIRNNGIFCIETKSYKGLLVGNEFSDNWTEVFYNKKYQIKEHLLCFIKFSIKGIIMYVIVKLLEFVIYDKFALLVVLALNLIGYIPYIGGPIKFIASMVGLGILCINAYKREDLVSGKAE